VNCPIAHTANQSNTTAPTLRPLPQGSKLPTTKRRHSNSETCHGIDWVPAGACRARRHTGKCYHVCLGPSFQCLTPAFLIGTSCVLPACHSSLRSLTDRTHASVSLRTTIMSFARGAPNTAPNATAHTPRSQTRCTTQTPKASKSLRKCPEICVYSFRSAMQACISVA
jgi:hypothetical protein